MRASDDGVIYQTAASAPAWALER